MQTVFDNAGVLGSFHIKHYLGCHHGNCLETFWNTWNILHRRTNVLRIKQEEQRLNDFNGLLSQYTVKYPKSCSLQAIIDHLAVQSFARTLIYCATLFINTLIQQRSLANLAAIFGDNC